MGFEVVVAPPLEVPPVAPPPPLPPPFEVEVVVVWAVPEPPAPEERVKVPLTPVMVTEPVVVVMGAVTVVELLLSEIGRASCRERVSR